MLRLLALLLSLVACTTHARTAAEYLPADANLDNTIPTPASVLGWEVGDWHVGHDALVHYLYRLADADLQASRPFADGVGRMGVYFPDWGPNYQIKGLRYDVPYRCLVPKAVEQLLIAGRCISTDRMVQGSIRVMPAAAMMGQAAGTAAVQAIQMGQLACDLDTAQLVTTLREHDAYLPQETLSATMTRS